MADREPIWKRCERLGLACESHPLGGAGVIGYAPGWPERRLTRAQATTDMLTTAEGHAYLDLVEHFSGVLVDMRSYHDKLAVEGDERP